MRRILARTRETPVAREENDCDIHHENVSFTQTEKGLPKNKIEASGVDQDDIADTRSHSGCTSSVFD
ncbi:MAG: hypothetical protein ACSLFQ_14005, partial [Thermoanaerobaculia bacterium]